MRGTDGPRLDAAPARWSEAVGAAPAWHHRAVPWEPLPGSRKDPDPLGRSLDRVVRSLGGPGVDVLSTVFSRWDELVGDQLAARTEPRGLRDGRLVVAVADPAWASQVRYLVPDLLARLDEAVGAGRITDVDVVVRRPDGRG